jgi:S-DNA-T family DNA segregation ATPase FtsK/SpoIIIE
MARRRARRKKTIVKVKRKTLFSIISTGIILLGILTIFSFLQKGAFLIEVNRLLRQYFGLVSVFIPFLLLSLGLLISRSQISLAQPHVFLGGILLFVSLLGLTKEGEVGRFMWQYVEFLITFPGAFLLFLFGILIGLAVIFNTSIERLIRLSIDSFLTFKRYLFSGRLSSGTFIKRKGVKGDIGEQIESEKVEPQPKVVESSSDDVPIPTPPSVLKKIPETKSPLDLSNIPSTPRIWKPPPLDILEDIEGSGIDRGNIKENAQTIEKTLDSFGIMARVVEINTGPSVTQYALEVALGTKLSKITALANDLALALAAPTGQIRIEAPIPGRSLVGIEVPNRVLQTVALKQILTSKSMRESTSKLTVPLGLDVSGTPKVADIKKMPHVLIAGQTGAGKSVLLNSWISTILFNTSPEEVRLILVDPKRVEMSRFNGVPHLLTPVIHEPSKILSALGWATEEMDKRYKLFAEVGVRDIDSYNEKAGFQSLPYIIIMIDELANIMLFAPAEVEDTVCRIAQMARATGIHLVLATQRPSVDVLTGLIKANIPCRISFAVSSMTDSRVILDTPGAERLLGRGDMLYIPTDQSKPTRIQGPFISDQEVNRLVQFLKEQGEVSYDEKIVTRPIPVSGSSSVLVNGKERDELFDEAAKLVIEAQKASASFLQRRLRLGYARAARILDQLEAAGIVGQPAGSKSREVLVTSLPSDESSENRG